MNISLLSKYSYLIYLVFGFQSCFNKTTPEIEVLPYSTIQNYCSVEDAKNRIVKDQYEFFFNKINSLDIAIQMKTEASFDSRKEAVTQYKQFLQDQVLAFNQEEELLLMEILHDCFQKIFELNSKLLPDSIHLIKTTGIAYGEGAFYTRENCIIIPQDELKQKDLTQEAWREKIQFVMMHELFHIISRENKHLKNALYKLIGFEKLQSKLIVPNVLKANRLLNPDGINISYYIKLYEKEAQTFKMAIPYLSSTSRTYSNKQSDFFNYIKFDLYEIEQTDESSYTLVCNEEGASLVTEELKQSFFKQIKDNTGYIIHPDEILADNFVFLLLMTPEEQSAKFSEGGILLLDKMLKVFEGY